MLFRLLRMPQTQLQILELEEEALTPVFHLSYVALLYSTLLYSTLLYSTLLYFILLYSTLIYSNQSIR